jgi:DNA polymerase III alpha subunit (gram-positive type)
MKILGIDLETTGLDTNTCAITEVGMVLWDTDLRTPVKLISYLVQVPKEVIWSEQVLKSSVITPELCSREGYPEEKAVRQFLAWYEQVDTICTHNGTRFDLPVLTSWTKKLGYDLEKKTHIDTLIDLRIPSHQSKKLSYMALDHGIVNNFAHRAVFDVMTMLRVLDLHPLEDVLRMARSPMLTIEAIVSYENRELAKTGGFYWKSENKKWLKDIKECELEEEQQEAIKLGFTAQPFPLIRPFTPKKESE